MPDAIEDIPIGEPFLYETVEAPEQVYEGEKICQRGAASLIQFHCVELGIGNRVAHTDPQKWYCIAMPDDPGYFISLNSFFPEYWQFKYMTSEDILEFGLKNPDNLAINRMRIIDAPRQHRAFMVGKG